MEQADPVRLLGVALGRNGESRSGALASLSRNFRAVRRVTLSTRIIEAALATDS
jgi:hypothetical protein